MKCKVFPRNGGSSKSARGRVHLAKEIYPNNSGVMGHCDYKFLYTLQVANKILISNELHQFLFSKSVVVQKSNEFKLIHVKIWLVHQAVNFLDNEFFRFIRVKYEIFLGKICIKISQLIHFNLNHC